MYQLDLRAGQASRIEMYQGRMVNNEEAHGMESA